MGGCTSASSSASSKGRGSKGKGRTTHGISTEVYVTGAPRSPKPQTSEVSGTAEETTSVPVGGGGGGGNHHHTKKDNSSPSSSAGNNNHHQHRETTTSSKKKATTDDVVEPRKHRDSSLSTRSITDEVRGSLSRTGSLQELLVSLHEEDSNIRSHYNGLDSTQKSSILGKGNWGTVKIVSRKRDGQKFACKELALSVTMPSTQIEELKSEIDSLSRIDHPHIARLYEAFEEPGRKLYLVMELLTGGELYTQLVEESQTGRFTEQRSMSLTRRMISALAYLHSQGIVHRDLKLENFVFRDKAPNSDKLVLIDFGLSKRFANKSSQRALGSDSGNTGRKRSSLSPVYTSTAEEPESEMEVMSSVVGSSYYIAPEVLEGKYSGPSCDMWSLGVIVYMMLCGKAPFNGRNEATIMKRCLIGEYTMNSAVWETISVQAKNFVSCCLVKDTKKRMTAAEALSHPWIVSLRENQNPTSVPTIPVAMIQYMASYADLSELVRIGCQAVAFSLSRSEIEEIADIFDYLDHDADGYLTEENIQYAFRQTLDGTEEFLDHTIVIPEERITRAANIAFEAMDFEGCGTLRFTCFIAACLPEKFFQDVSTLKESFSKLDHKHKGYISISDLERLNFRTDHAQNIFHDFLIANVKDPVIDPVANLKVEFRDYLLAMRRRGSNKNDANSTLSRSSTANKKKSWHLRL